MLSDPQVSDPIYDLPRPFTHESVGRWVGESEALRQKGECILSVGAGRGRGGGRLFTLHDLAGAFIGGRRSPGRGGDLQNAHAGKTGVARSILFMFEHLGVRLIALTAALDNVRSAASIDAAGFQADGRGGERAPRRNHAPLDSTGSSAARSGCAPTACSGQRKRRRSLRTAAVSKCQP